MACNEMFGAGKEGLIQPPDPEKTYCLKQCEIAIFQREIWNLYCDYKIIFDSVMLSFPKETKREKEALFIGNQICNHFQPKDPSTWPICRKIAQKFLEQTNGSSAHNITPIGHCHIDTGTFYGANSCKILSYHLPHFFLSFISLALAIFRNQAKMCKKLEYSVGIYEI